jgi:hypothetical protein
VTPIHRPVLTSSTQNVAEVEPDFGVGTVMVQENVPVAVVAVDPLVHAGVELVAPDDAV